MRYYMAPMEGITGYIYRNTHAAYYGGCARYYMPFVDPKDQASLMRKEKKDIAPENNRGLEVVPQILTNRPEKFLAVADRLGDLGYQEVNLNLGCPSGTVVSSGKGAGFLSDPDQLRVFFEEVFRDSDRPGGMCCSVKTRLGMTNPQEIEGLVDIFNDYPISELIIHARVREDYYKKPVHPEAFRRALEKSRHPVCYNGDLLDQDRVDRFCADFPEVDRIMLGRGLIGDPGLAEALVARESISPTGNDFGQEACKKDYRKTRDFLRELCSRYEKEIGNNALFKMKEIWTYMLPSYERSRSAGKKLMKSRRLSDYRIHMEAIFREYV